MRFGLPAELPQTIKKLAKRADIICAYYEAIELAGFDEKEAARIFGAARALYTGRRQGVRVGAYPPARCRAEILFRERFEEIEALRVAETKNGHNRKKKSA